MLNTKPSLLRLGDNLFINPDKFEFNLRKPLVIDCETAEDEPATFVGIALCQESDKVYYFTKLFPDVLKYLEKCQLIGHSIKGDMRWLHQWGVKIKPEQLEYDTILASYVRNSTKLSHSLKTLGREILGIEWSTYKGMVHPDPEHPKKKVTLDKQPIETVAQYCGMDALVTLSLADWFKRHLNQTETKILREIEIPTARVLLAMELEGVKLDLKYLKELQTDLSVDLLELTNTFKTMGVENPDSNIQIADLLERLYKIKLPLTKKGNRQVNKQVLYSLKHLPIVEHLLKYSEVEKLLSTYINPYLQLANKNSQIVNRVHCQFNQITKDEKGDEVGISTSRLSSSNPNLQNIPTRTERGQMIRKAFIPDEGNVFLEADFSQIEPRLIAHFSGDEFLTSHFLEDRDPYLTLSELTGQTRADCKTFLLALLYGAQPKKLATVFKCTEAEASRVLGVMSKQMPSVVSFRNRTIYEARKNKGVTTLHNRFIPLPGIDDTNRYERLHWERVAVNSKIQGSAAEIMKLGLIKLYENECKLKLTVHDSYLIQVDPSSYFGNGITHTELEVKPLLESLVKLSVPLKVKIGVGDNWSECK